MSAAYADMECEEMVAADVAIARSVPHTHTSTYGHGVGLYKPHNMRSQAVGPPGLTA